jgi:hypothetical protein
MPRAPVAPGADLRAARWLFGGRATAGSPNRSPRNFPADNLAANFAFFDLKGRFRGRKPLPCSDFINFPEN